MRKRLSKNRKRGDHKAYQFDKWGNVVDDSIGEGTYDNYSKRRDPVKKNMDKFHKPKTHRDKTKYNRKAKSKSSD